MIAVALLLLPPALLLLPPHLLLLPPLLAMNGGSTILPFGTADPAVSGQCCCLISQADKYATHFHTA